MQLGLRVGQAEGAASLTIDDAALSRALAAASHVAQAAQAAGLPVAPMSAGDVLSMRDRRLLLMAVIATYGTVDIWNLQARAALQNGELDPNELRETLVLLASYAGYPNVAGLVGETEGVIAAWESEQQATNV